MDSTIDELCIGDAHTARLVSFVWRNFKRERAADQFVARARARGPHQKCMPRIVVSCARGEYAIAIAVYGEYATRG